MLSDHHHQSKKATEEQKVESGRQSSTIVEDKPNIVGNDEDFENYLYDAE